MALTYEEYYGDDFFRLKRVEEILLDTIRQYPAKDYSDGVEPILYCKSRIKNPDSMIHKLKKRGVATDGKTAIRETHDAVGVRIICSFIDDVYKISQWLSTQNNFTIVATKDYIAYPKPNGYRSLHLILKFHDGPEQGIQAEIQLRTIAIDFWAALEHQMKYKKNIQYEKTICDELKRCADEIASVDMSMQALRDIIQNDKWD